MKTTTAERKFAKGGSMKTKFRLVIGGTVTPCRAKYIDGAIAALKRAMKTTFCSKGQVQVRGSMGHDGWYVLWTQREEP